ncbi:hypothetical protein FRC12_012631 [Ceratobasidium sp. 428]|nr:hypothetical protein FRC12_012631 [Ceratobasidium sp. 428]
MSVRLARIPELVEAILEINNYTTGHALMLSCKRLFHLLAPQFWRRVKGAEQIFALLPGAAVRIDKGNKAKIPRSLKGNDLIRLKFYAEFVHDLEVFKFEDYRYNFSNLDHLQRFAAHNPLLPNIFSLSFHNLKWNDNGEHPQLSLLLMFLSPSLHVFRTPLSDLEISPKLSVFAAITVLCVLAERCSNVHTLEIFCDPQYDIAREARHPSSVTSITQHLASIPLRSLSTSTYMLRFKAAHSLSNLERLELDLSYNSGLSLLIKCANG